MLKGLYTAATGMNVQAKKLDIISNDLANTGTTAYKREKVSVTSFKEEYLKRLDDSQNFVPNDEVIGKITYGAKVDEVYTDFTQGPIISTGSDTNVALQGDGFFVVQTPNGEAYTRDGSFTVNEFGDLVTLEGYSVMGEEGAINLGEDYFTTGDKVIIQPDGVVIVGEQYMDRLDIAKFDDSRTLQKLDDNYYISEGERVPFTGTMIQGYLETSNVNTIDAMVDMITVARAYETNQKMIQTLDQNLGMAVNDLGRA